jgi:hypothetical protein
MASNGNARRLPSREQLELANYKLGSFISDLADFRLDGLADRSTMSYAEYEQHKAAGTLPPSEEPLDRDLLAVIVVFAAEALEDAKAITEYAEKLLHDAVNLRREEISREQVDAYYQRAREWHLAEAEQRVG